MPVQTGSDKPCSHTLFYRNTMIYTAVLVTLILITELIGVRLC